RTCRASNSKADSAITITKEASVTTDEDADIIALNDPQPQTLRNYYIAESKRFTVLLGKNKLSNDTIATETTTSSDLAKGLPTTKSRRRYTVPLIDIPPPRFVPQRDNVSTRDLLYSAWEHERKNLASDFYDGTFKMLKAPEVEPFDGTFCGLMRSVAPTTYSRVLGAINIAKSVTGMMGGIAKWVCGV
ncbi:hypothetical protein BC829DRAFT_387631, partial [Chytridium lagenaria]